MFSFPIDYYDNGYKVHDLTCVDIPLAAACGTYDYSNYFYYVALYALCVNYNFCSDWDVLHNNIVAPMGLRICRNEINPDCGASIWALLSEKISSSIPVMVVLKTSETFYIVKQEDGVEKDYHGVVLSGISTGDGLVLLNDCEMQAELNSKYIPGQPFTKLILKKNDVIEMISRSISNMQDIGPRDYTSIFTVEKTNHAEISEWLAFLKWWTQKFDYHNDVLISELGRFNEFSKNYTDYSYIFDIRLNTYTAMKNLFTTLQLIVFSYDVTSIRSAEIEHIQELCLNIRRRIVNCLQISAVRKQALSKTLIREFIDELLRCNQELFNLAHCIATEISSYGRNLSFTAEISADSEQILPNGIVRKARNVSNGNWQDFRLDSWQSIENKDDHWLLFDFGQTRNLSKIIIRHMKINIMKTYRIETSMDGINWSIWGTVYNNELRELTSHVVSNVQCRFIKIIIPSCGEIDSAGFWEVDVYGN